MAVLSWRELARPRHMRKLWSNLKPNHSTTFREQQLADKRERTDYPKGKRTEDTSRERRIESQLRAAAQRAYRDQQDATDPMVAPQDYDVRQFGRVLELQNSDLWLRPTDLNWPFPILMTIREEPFKNYRSITSEKWKAKEDKAEEFNKQKMQKNDDGQSCANWQTSSWSWHQAMTWASSSWQQWSSDETRECVLIGKHHLIGRAQTHCVNDPDGDHRVPDSHHSHGSEE